MSIFYNPTPDFYNDYIAHHGIKGQQWGKRNGPPYPLGSGGGSKSSGDSNKGSIQKKKTNPKSKAETTKYESIKDLQNDKTVDFADWSYGGSASKKITKNDLKIIKEVKDDPQIKKVIQDYKSSKGDDQENLYKLHNELYKIADNISKNNKLYNNNGEGLDYLGFGSQGAQLGYYNPETGLYFDVFINDKGNIIVDLDDWD